MSWCSPMAVNFIVTVDRIRKSDPKENVLIASTFGIVSIVTRRNNIDEAAASWLIEKLDQVELGNSDGRADGSNSNKIENEILSAMHFYFEYKWQYRDERRSPSKFHK